VLASVSPRAGRRGGRSKLAATDALVEEYLGRLEGRAGKWLVAEARGFGDEAGLLAAAAKAEKQRGELALMDSGGKPLTSEDWAEWLRSRRDAGVEELWVAVGPADGWSAAAKAGRGRASKIISLGPATMAHELARVVVAEQIYRAWAIVEGHPYHRGH
jgi:23S rRNA (pseudouridine1915-N3)-methyltransferase